jgi:hypothetical protein
MTAGQFQPGLVVVGRADPSTVVLHLGTTAAPTQKTPVCVILPERRAALQAYAQMEKIGARHG